LERMHLVERGFGGGGERGRGRVIGRRSDRRCESGEEVFDGRGSGESEVGEGRIGGVVVSWFGPCDGLGHEGKEETDVGDC